MNVSQEELGLLCGCAVRYALGRSDTLVLAVCDTVRRHALDLTPEERIRIADDIEAAQIPDACAGELPDWSNWTDLEAFLRKITT